MRNRLNALEKRAVNDLLSWDRTRHKPDLIASYLALFLGGVIVLVVSSYTLDHLDDATIYAVTLRGFVAAIVYFGVYVFLSSRAREKHRLAGIIRKLEDNSA